jgi:hypothetical protein
MKQLFYNAIFFILLFPGYIYSQSFTKITDGAIVNDGGWSYGCCWADLNNDGFQDLFVVNNQTGNKNNLLYMTVEVHTDVPVQIMITTVTSISLLQITERTIFYTTITATEHLQKLRQVLLLVMEEIQQAAPGVIMKKTVIWICSSVTETSQIFFIEITATEHLQKLHPEQL